MKTFAMTLLGTLLMTAASVMAATFAEGNAAYMRGADFHGPVSFRGAHFKHQFVLQPLYYLENDSLILLWLAPNQKVWPRV